MKITIFIVLGLIVAACRHEMVDDGSIIDRSAIVQNVRVLTKQVVKGGGSANAVPGAIGGAVIAGPIGAIIGGVAGAYSNPERITVETICQFMATVNSVGTVQFRNEWMSTKSCEMLQVGDNIIVRDGHTYLHLGGCRILEWRGYVAWLGPADLSGFIVDERRRRLCRGD